MIQKVTALDFTNDDHIYFQEARMPGSNYSVAYVGHTLSDEIIAKYEAQAGNLKAQL